MCGAIIPKVEVLFVIILIFSALTFASTISDANDISVPPFRLFSVETWCNRRVDNLRFLVEPLRPLELNGMQNDRLVGAIAVEGLKDEDVTATLKGPNKLLSVIDMKVVGHTQGPKINDKISWWFDPLFSNMKRYPDLSEYINNWAVIKNFPLLHLKYKEYVLLWLTVKTDSLKPGQYMAQLVLTGKGRYCSKADIQVCIWPVELPKENPIAGLAWTPVANNRELATLIKDYGINVCGGYQDWDICHELGYRFYMFVLPGFGFSEDVIDTVPDEDFQKLIQPFRDVVERLKLRPEQWAIEISDEPTDASAELYVKHMKRIKKLWPEARFWANPAMSPKNNHYSTPGCLVKLFKPYVRTWCPYVELLASNPKYTGRPSLLEPLKATGDPVWYYWMTSRYRRPSIGGRRTPLISWKYGLDGWAFYALVPVEEGDPWKDNIFAHMYPHNTVSLWMEGLRQGVQDYKRLWLLEKNGVSREELMPLVDNVLAEGLYRPWAESSPERISTLRSELDRLIVENLVK